ncbi:MAG: HD domain-containing protein, partial [Duncaniella dubosii]|nr:HD domain-containing protein [Duncaniella dubosii]
MEKTPRPSDERAYIRNLVRRLLVESSDVAKADDFAIVKKAIKNAYADGRSVMDRHGLNKVAHTLETSIALCDMVSPDRNMIIATLVYGLCVDEALSLENVRSLWDEDVERMVNGLRKVSTLYGKQGVVKTDNFRRLLMTFAEDIRVIIIMIVERLTLMRA